MKTVELVQQSDAGRVLRMEVPVDQASQRYRVIIQLEAESDDEAGLDEWPPGFFERTAGQWVGELKRAPQGDYERREQM